MKTWNYANFKGKLVTLNWDVTSNVVYCLWWIIFYVQTSQSVGQNLWQNQKLLDDWKELLAFWLNGWFICSLSNIDTRSQIWHINGIFLDKIGIWYIRSQEKIEWLFFLNDNKYWRCKIFHNWTLKKYVPHFSWE